MPFMRQYRRILAALAAAIFLAAALLFLGTDYYVEKNGSQYICSPSSVPEGEAILILGAYVFPDGKLSDMLRDRVIVGYELYQQGRAPKIIVSGDHSREDYDEVNSMKDSLIGQGVPGQDVFMDHAGFSTYESIYRVRDIFKAHRVIIVTQEYHLPRALFIARALGLESYGVPSDLHQYGSAMSAYLAREKLARNKDFWLAKIIRPQPTFLGEAIPLSGDGRATDDR